MGWAASKNSNRVMFLYATCCRMKGRVHGHLVFHHKYKAQSQLARPHRDRIHRKLKWLTIIILQWNAGVKALMLQNPPHKQYWLRDWFTQCVPALWEIRIPRTFGKTLTKKEHPITLGVWTKTNYVKTRK